MTAVIHHGPPGSFKSFSIVQRVVIPALEQGRPVVTNIRGLHDLDHIADTMGVSIPESTKIYAVDADSQDGFDYIARFFHWAPAGALIVIDEGQRAYPTRLRSLSTYDQADDIPLENPDGTPLLDHNGQPINRPSTLENAFDQHRHCNWDIYISTPNIGKIHKEIRGVVEWAYRHRDITGFNPFSKKQKWREFKHDSEASGKSPSHYFGTPKTYTVDQRVFSCYLSTKTGKAKRSTENISILRDTKFRLAIGIFIVSCLFVGSQVRDVYRRFSSPGEETRAPVVAMDSSGAHSSRPTDTSHVNSLDGHQRRYTSDHPLNGYTLYYVGEFGGQMMFHAYPDEHRYIVLTSDDLSEVGYTVDMVSGRLVIIDHPVIPSPIYATNQPRRYISTVEAERSYASDAPTVDM